MFGFFKRIAELEDRVQELEVKVCNLNRLTKRNDQDIDELVETLDVIDDTMDSLAQALLASLKEKMPKKKAGRPRKIVS